MIRIDRIAALSCRHRGPRWRVTFTSPRGETFTFDSESCELAVEYALLELALRRWRKTIKTVPAEEVRYEGSVTRDSLTPRFTGLPSVYGCRRSCAHGTLNCPPRPNPNRAHSRHWWRTISS
jgi:hypothetical protein